MAKGAQLDFNPYHLGIDNGADLFAEDVSIDVKAPFWRLHIVPHTGKFRADVVVSCEQVKDGIGIVGWASKQRFLERAQVRDLGYGETMALPDSELTDISVYGARLLRDE